jgi:hypothetical protein
MKHVCDFLSMFLTCSILLEFIASIMACLDVRAQKNLEALEMVKFKVEVD